MLSLILNIDSIHGVSSITLKEVEESNLSKDEVFALINEINRLNKNQYVTNEEYIKTKLLEYKRDNMRYNNLISELSYESRTKG